MKTLIKTSPLFFILFLTVIVFSCKKDKVSSQAAARFSAASRGLGFHT